MRSFSMNISMTNFHRFKITLDGIPSLLKKVSGEISSSDGTELGSTKTILITKRSRNNSILPFTRISCHNLKEKRKLNRKTGFEKNDIQKQLTFQMYSRLEGNL